MLSYDDLCERSDGPPGSSWGLFGSGDELGTLNHLTADRVIAATKLVHQGKIFNLDLRLDAFDPPITHREPPQHSIFSHAAYHRDDVLDRLYLQGTSQIDGLRHFRHPHHGFYNGVPDSDIAESSESLGIQRMAERGIVGRGVLLDVSNYLTSKGQGIDHERPTSITSRDLDATAAAQGVDVHPGDIVLVHTGWVKRILESNARTKAQQVREPKSPGLEQSHDIIRWLWDHQISLVAADNLGVEVIPPVWNSPFRSDPTLQELEGRHVGMAHPVLLALLGLPLGELWWLEDLAIDCLEDSVWEFMLTAHPLNILGGVGSPPNAMAIK